MKKKLFMLSFSVILCLHFSLTQSAESPSRMDKIGKLTRVAAAPENVFNYPYYLYLPLATARNKSQYLLVQPNNTGSPNDDLEVYDEDARHIAVKSSIGNAVSRALGFPSLVPVFPRPEREWKIYTHALDRDTIWIRDGDMKRLDL